MFVEMSRMIAGLLLVGAWAYPAQADDLRDQMRDAASEKAEVTPEPPAPRPAVVAPAKARALLRVEAHRLAVEAAADAAGLRRSTPTSPGVPPATHRATDGNAAAQGVTHAAANVARMSDVKQNHPVPDHGDDRGDGRGNVHGNGNGDGNPNGNGHPHGNGNMSPGGKH
jgi:hypothetical protein